MFLVLISLSVYGKYQLPLLRVFLWESSYYAMTTRMLSLLSSFFSPSMVEINCRLSSLLWVYSFQLKDSWPLILLYIRTRKVTKSNFGILESSACGSYLFVTYIFQEFLAIKSGSWKREIFGLLIIFNSISKSHFTMDVNKCTIHWCTTPSALIMWSYCPCLSIKWSLWQYNCAN